MLFLSTPRVPLRPPFCTQEPASHFISCYDNSEEDDFHSIDYETQELCDFYDNYFSRSRPGIYCDWDPTRESIYDFRSRFWRGRSARKDIQF
jgi:hypothetical protein